MRLIRGDRRDISLLAPLLTFPGSPTQGREPSRSIPASSASVIWCASMAAKA